MSSAEAGHLQWQAEALWQQLGPLLPGLSIEIVSRTDSTNTQLLERARLSSGRRDQPITTPAPFDVSGPGSLGGDDSTPYGRRAGDTQPCLLVAEHQTRGRGRHGRTWQGSAGASLTFSLALPLDPADWSGLSLAVGVALADALDPPGAAPRIGLKWPNDLWLLDPVAVGRKLGGILIETVAVGVKRMAVIGVGLNVLPQSTRDLASGYACLQELQPEIDAPAALHQVARPLVQALLAFEREGFPAFVDRFSRRDLLRGRAVATTAADVPAGVGDGVGQDGALRVRVGDTVHRLASAEVSVRPEGEPPAA